jgi:hypothetical protein
MKLRPIFTSLLSVLVLAALSCHQDTIIDPKAEGSSAKVVSDSIDYEAEGIFMYKTLKFHSSHFDA